MPRAARRAWAVARTGPASAAGRRPRRAGRPPSPLDAGRIAGLDQLLEQRAVVHERLALLLRRRLAGGGAPRDLMRHAVPLDRRTVLDREVLGALVGVLGRV